MAVTNLFRDMIFVCQSFGIKCNRRKGYEPIDVFNPKFTLKEQCHISRKFYFFIFLLFYEFLVDSA